MLDFISYPIGAFLRIIYNTLAFKNYGLSIILLTVIIKTLVLPLTIKQYRSTAKISEIQPQIQEIQKKYKNDPQKLNAETVKLYQEYKINPASGCLPLLIQMPVLFSLYYVISQPLKYMFKIPKDVISQIFSMIPAEAVKSSNLHDLSIIDYFSHNLDKLSSANGLITQDNLLNMKFFGINLGAIPSLDPSRLFGSSPDMQAWYLLIIPVLAIVTTFISTKYSMNQTPQQNTNPSQNSMMNSMTLISPIMTGFISFTVPAGLGIYWIISNVFQLGQQLFMNKYIINKASSSKNKPLSEPSS
ncbi:YidC/Oxa1 family membrane protein insertase [Clostridium swellfunianum]|uniref:YidC/Oxa1 family membrane protein insertase n=1 Tax=Clostridium swellfunianum TaxID=1367462 RepID=UPI002030C480|nr:YidC/Oxa1 family membrane protein insertase [Clostridium swellfunianum]